jgi:hypothetical protein
MTQSDKRSLTLLNGSETVHIVEKPMCDTSYCLNCTNRELTIFMVWFTLVTWCLTVWFVILGALAFLMLS